MGDGGLPFKVSNFKWDCLNCPFKLKNLLLSNQAREETVHPKKLMFGLNIIRIFLYLILLLRLNHKIKNANHGVTLKIKNSAINLYIFV